MEGGGSGVFAFVVFVEVDEEVGLNEDLVIGVVDIGVGVMVSDEEADAVDDVGVDIEVFEQAAGFGGAFLFLERAGAASELGFGRADADIVKIGRASCRERV